MSIHFRIDDQVLKVADASDAAEAVVHKYDAFLNLLCSDRYAFPPIRYFNTSTEKFKASEGVVYAHPAHV